MRGELWERETGGETRDRARLTFSLQVGPDAVHAFKRDSRTGEWYSSQTWDFVATHPEALQTQLMIYTDRVGTPKSFRMQHWFPTNTFSMINAKKVIFFPSFNLSLPSILIFCCCLGETLGEIPHGQPARMGGHDQD